MSTSFIPLVSVEEVDRQALRNTERLNRHPEMLKVASLLLQILEGKQVGRYPRLFAPPKI